LFRSRYHVEQEYDASVDVEVAGLTRERQETLRRRDSLVARREEAIRARGRYHAPVVPYASSWGPIDARYPSASAASWEANTSRLRILHQRADVLRSRAAELQRWIAELDSKSFTHASLGHTPYRSGEVHSLEYPLPRHWQDTSAEQLQSRIRQADREIVSLRRVLSDVRGLRNLLASSVRQDIPYVSSYEWLDDSWMQGRRYDYFVREIDRYRSDRPWGDFYNRAYQPLRPVDDLAMRVEATTRHLDWLLSRFDASGSADASRLEQPYTWIYENQRGGVMEESLRRVRSQLRQRDYLNASSLDATIAELTRSLDYLMSHRHRVVEMLASRHNNWQRDFAGVSSRELDWSAERRAANEELAGIENELRRVLDQTASLRHSQRHLPIIDPVYPIGMRGVGVDYTATAPYGTVGSAHADTVRAESLRSEVFTFDEEIARCNERLTALDVQIRTLRARPVRVRVPNEELARLNRRRDEIVAELNRFRPIARRESSLAELASRWLVRLSGGRHRVIRWTVTPAPTDPYTTLEMNARHADFDPGNRTEGRRVAVVIDDVDERSVTAATRSVACLAVRMAAGELLGRMGQAIPLVMETHSELFAGRDAYPIAGKYQVTAPEAYQHWTREGIFGDTIASALADYAAAGRQLLVLTEHAPLADVLKRSGARSFALHTQRIVHPHRPMWRDGERHDRYTGPHTINVDGLPAGGRKSEMDWTDAGSANREFDRAWRETAGLRDEASYCAAATDAPAGGAAYRDGYYYSDQSSTCPVANEVTETHSVQPGTLVSHSLTSRHHSDGDGENVDVPFFLTVDSPIDAAPSIDAVAAQRLRRIGISHITHLMNQDSNRLADTLGLAGVDAKTVRRWQAECRLMCRVPQLRGFDARVLVGCGVTDPAQLAAIHPTDLLDRV
ncbi:MAG: DUF4332 domain-containing protein, partial [Rhodopirellula sp. JB053]